MVECLETLQQPLLYYPYVLAVVGRLNNEHFSNFGVKMSFLKFYFKICCRLQTTIDFLIHLSYKTGHFGGLYKIP